jgi:hypothetical protein
VQSVETLDASVVKEAGTGLADAAGDGSRWLDGSRGLTIGPSRWSLGPEELAAADLGLAGQHGVADPGVPGQPGRRRRLLVDELH